MSKSNAYLFGDCADLLRANDYAPAPLDADEQPKGPYLLTQLPYPTSDNSHSPAAVLCRVPWPRSEHDAVQNPRSIALVSVTIRVDDQKLAAAIDRYIIEHVGKSPAHVADGATTYVFRYEDDESFEPMRNDGQLSIESTGFVQLGSPEEWRDGKDLINTPRSALPLIGRAEAVALYNAIFDILPSPPSSAALLAAPRLAELKPGESFRYGNLRGQMALRKNGYLSAAIDWTGADAHLHVGASWSDFPEHGVAVMAAPTRNSPFQPPVNEPLVTLWLKRIEHAQVRKLVEKLIDQHFPGAPVRVASDGSSLRVMQRGDWGGTKPVEFMRSVWNRRCEHVPRTSVSVRIREPNAFVVCGLDEKGHEFKWRDNRDLLTIPQSALPLYDYASGLQLTQALERLLQSGELGDELTGAAA